VSEGWLLTDDDNAKLCSARSLASAKKCDGDLLFGERREQSFSTAQCGGRRWLVAVDDGRSVLMTMAVTHQQSAIGADP
jgi:hypothetical protein